MTKFSFTDAVRASRPIEVADTPAMAVASQNAVRYITQISANVKDPSRNTYSIDPASLLQVLESDQINKIIDLSLPVSQSDSGMGIWNVSFSSLYNQGFNACIFAAQGDLHPLPMSRERVRFDFVSGTRKANRYSLQAVSEGDSVVIGIYSARTATTYMLIYQVRKSCALETPDSTRGRAMFTPAVNAKLVAVWKIDRKASATILPVQTGIDTDTDMGLALASHVMGTLKDKDTETFYPWTAHLRATVPTQIDAAALESRLEVIMGEDTASAAVTYDYFMDVCRDLYRSKTQEYLAANAKSRDQAPEGKGRRGIDQKPYIAYIELIGKLGDTNMMAIVPSAEGGESHVLSFDLEEHLDKASLEPFLFGVDLKDCQPDTLRHVKEVFPLSSTSFETGMYHRTLRLAF